MKNFEIDNIDYWFIYDLDSKNTTIFKSKQELVDITVEIWSLPFVQSMIHLDYFRSTQQYDTNWSQYATLRYRHKYWFVFKKKTNEMTH